MAEEIRLCMIGAGRHASKKIYPCFRFLEGARVVANCDLDEERARVQARLHGIPTSYTDYQQMLDTERPNGVLVCVGPDFHAQAAVDLMEQGYNVYTEKPPAVTAEQCRQVLVVQQRTGRLCMTAFKKRYAPAYVKTKAIIQGSDFGEPALLSILRTSGHYRNVDDPRSQYILDSAIHAVDLASYLFGYVASVSAAKKPPANYAVRLQFANGAVGTLSLTDRMSYRRGWEQMTVIGTEGVCVQVDNSVEMLAFKFDRPIAAHKPEFVAGTSHSLIEMGFVPELQAFVEAIACGRQPESNIQESTHTMAIIEAVRRSAESGTVVEVQTAS
jgi:predicted dehydrogenase